MINQCVQAPRAGSYPCVLKVGHAHGGLGKVKVETESAYQVRASILLELDSTLSQSK